jgi:two-component system cell cycle sensor histidine kinase/response regulator CckA
MTETPMKDFGATEHVRRWKAPSRPADLGRGRILRAGRGVRRRARLAAGPATLAGLLLLGGVAGVAILGLVAIRASTAVTDPEPEGVEAFVEALSEPAALTAADGRLLAANAAWVQAVGDARRLPKGAAGAGLFAALVKARDGERAEGTLIIAGQERRAEAARLRGGRCWSACRSSSRRRWPFRPPPRPRRRSPRPPRLPAPWTPSPAPRRSARPCWRGWTRSTPASSRPTRPWPP